jgi:hypothetical protein
MVTEKLAPACETQLVDFIQELAKSNNCSKQITKAFDKVPHCRLLYKLEFQKIY